MLPPPPRSTLFPYTTLFRSNRKTLPTFHFTLEARRKTTHHAFSENNHSPKDNHFFQVQNKFPTLKSPFRIPHRRDRKSTRLNSSHMSISYAVFCLKKKNKKP